MNGAEADSNTLGDGSFPLARDVFNVTREGKEGKKGSIERKRDNAAKRFVNFICNPEGTDPVTGRPYRELVDQVIEANGFGVIPCRDETA